MLCCLDMHLSLCLGEQTMEMKKYKTRLRQLDQQVTDSEEEEDA